MGIAVATGKTAVFTKPSAMGGTPEGTRCYSVGKLKCGVISGGNSGVYVCTQNKTRVWTLSEDCSAKDQYCNTKTNKCEKLSANNACNTLEKDGRGRVCFKGAIYDCLNGQLGDTDELLNCAKNGMVCGKNDDNHHVCKFTNVTGSCKDNGQLVCATNIDPSRNNLDIYKCIVPQNGGPSYWKKTVECGDYSCQYINGGLKCVAADYFEGEEDPTPTFPPGTCDCTLGKTKSCNGGIQTCVQQPDGCPGKIKTGSWGRCVSNEPDPDPAPTATPKPPVWTPTPRPWI